MVFETGRVCVKIAGRDAGNYCVVVEKLDGAFVLIDGATRRRKCNVSHLEPLELTVSVTKSSKTADVLAALKKAGLHVEVAKTADAARVKQRETKVKRPRRLRSVKEKTAQPEKKAAAPKEAAKAKK